ncbi:MAG: hypothetical protein ACLQVJ_14990 [Syntrophobacteraceae bacterium]
MPKRVWELQEPHLSAREIALSLGLLLQVHINLPCVDFGYVLDMERSQITHSGTPFRRVV